MPPLVTVTPDSLTLNPGESAQVTVQVDPLSDSGSTLVLVGVTVPPQYDYLISGDFQGTIGPGETAHIVGDVNQTGPVSVEGLLTGIDTFHWQGNGFTVFFQNGGQADLHGKYKAPWGPWDTNTTGWEPGDRLGVAPTAVGKYVPSELAWSDWTMPRPADSPDVTLIDGSIRKPEVVNLDQSIVFENLARGFHFHDSAGVQMMSDVKFLNCGTTGVLSNYPVHFHQLYDNSRGSLLERVVVEGGLNHAFVPHGSHGITFRDCAAYNTINNAYWWDPPPSQADTSNDTDDVLFDHCLAGWVNPVPGSAAARLTAFHLGRGVHGSNMCRDSVAYGVQGGKNSSGFLWPEGAGSVWIFETCTAHNNKSNGIFVWQNSGSAPHNIDDYTGYHNGKNQIEHGAYTNGYQYRRCVLHGGQFSVKLHARSDTDRMLLFEDVIASTPLEVTAHQASADAWTVVSGGLLPSVVYNELANNGTDFSWIRYEDQSIVPGDFTFTTIHPDTVIEIVEGGVLTYRWAAGVWS